MGQANPGEFETAQYEPVEDDTIEKQASRYFEAEPRARIEVEVHGKTHPGMVRENNEDQYLAVRRLRTREILATSMPVELLEPGVDSAYAFSVADGLGGQKFGEIASLVTLRNGFEMGGDEIKWTVRLNDEEIEDLRRKAEIFCKLLDESLRREIQDNPRLAGMATTLTLCYTTGPHLFTVHVGDSRAYLFREGSLSQLTRDHTLGQHLIDLGEVEAGSPQARRFRHILTNCIGGTEANVFVDFGHHILEDGDVVVLCTDGLYEMVSDPEITAVLKGDLAVKDCCERLMELALKNGGKDNITILAARFKFAGQR